MECNPDKQYLCLHGKSDSSWQVTLPADQVPSELPEPTIGINFARDGMTKTDWLRLVAVHSDAWLLSLAMGYFASQLDRATRLRLFTDLNELPTLYEILCQKKSGRSGHGTGGRRAQGSEHRDPSGRLLTYSLITPDLKNTKAELYWPDDRMWYSVQIHSVAGRLRQAKICYTSGEFEDLALDEIIQEGHMNILPKEPLTVELKEP